MVVVWLIAGIACLSAGLIAIVFGIPVKEFSFGNTMIVSGTLVACTGLLILAMWVMLRELRSIAQQFGAGGAVEAAGLDDQPAAIGGFSFGRGRPLSPPADSDPADQAPTDPPWRGEPPQRERGRANPSAGEAEPAGRPRRDLAFPTGARKERGQGRAAENPIPDFRPHPLDAALAPEPNEPPSAAFDESWPKVERSRPLDGPQRRGGRTPLRPAEASGGAGPPSLPPGAARREERKAVTLLKSGIVDGMAYSLYSDGSIEAQMPEGMMRFASIDELRSHLDQRS
jgi:hypothetical protein